MIPPNRMRLSSLGMVNRIADHRAALSHRIAILESKEEPRAFGQPLFCITIDGQRLDDDLLAITKPALIGELRAQIARIDRDLLALGVDVAAT